MYKQNTPRENAFFFFGWLFSFGKTTSRGSSGGFFCTNDTRVHKTTPTAITHSYIHTFTLFPIIPKEEGRVCFLRKYEHFCGVREIQKQSKRKEKKRERESERERKKRGGKKGVTEDNQNKERFPSPNNKYLFKDKINRLTQIQHKNTHVHTSQILLLLFCNPSLTWKKYNFHQTLR